MAARLATVAVLAVALGLAATAAAQSPSDRKAAIDEKITQLRDKIAAAKRREGVLTDEISEVTGKIRVLEQEVGTVTARLATLEGELAVQRRRLAIVTDLLELQTRKLLLLRRQNALAQRRLNERIVSIYQSDDPTTVEVVLAASSLGELLDQLEYRREIGDQDRRIAAQVSEAKRQVREARERTKRTRAKVVAVTREIESRARQELAERERLVASENALADARAEKRETLEGVRTDKRDFLHEVEGLEAASAALAARIRAAQASASTAPSGTVGSDRSPSAAGLIWPVAGPVTSGFGWRWGRMHEGIDIGAPSGAPIQAAASGVVIYAGWMDGYGNLVVIDHGNGLATAYGHQSAIAAGMGQQVAQGQVIGYVGCTGHCFGSHLHFEVRVNGAPVDPLGYL
jgi:peptidoglycan DL-endopeptidase CwlO